MDTPNGAQFSWTGYEYLHTEKGNDWFWALGIIAFSSALASFLLGNIMFSFIILVGALVAGMFAAKKPPITEFFVTGRGIVVGSTLYSYQNLKSFWVHDDEGDIALLLLESKKLAVPQIVIPVPEDQVAPEELRDFLLNKLYEKEQNPPLSQGLLEFFGF